MALPYKGDAFAAIALLPAEGVALEAALKDWSSGPQVGGSRRDWIGSSYQDPMGGTGWNEHDWVGLGGAGAA